MLAVYQGCSDISANLRAYQPIANCVISQFSRAQGQLNQGAYWAVAMEAMQLLLYQNLLQEQSHFQAGLNLSQGTVGDNPHEVLLVLTRHYLAILQLRIGHTVVLPCGLKSATFLLEMFLFHSR